MINQKEGQQQQKETLDTDPQTYLQMPSSHSSLVAHRTIDPPAGNCHRLVPGQLTSHRVALWWSVQPIVAGGQNGDSIGIGLYGLYGCILQVRCRDCDGP